MAAFIAELIFFVGFWGGLAIKQTIEKKQRQAWLQNKIDTSKSAAERSFYVERLANNK